MKKSTKILLGIGGLLAASMFLCAAAVLFSTISQEAFKQGLAKGQADAAEGKAFGEALVEPTWTVAPTLAPTTEPMATLAPTSTPEPTQEFGNDVSEAERQYLDAAMGYMTSLGQYMTELSALSYQGSEDPMLFLDAEWVGEFENGLDAIMEVTRLLVYLDEPPAFYDWTATLVIMHGEAERMRDNMMSGIDNLDADKLEAGLENLNEINRCVEKLSLKLAEWMED